MTSPAHIASTTPVTTSDLVTRDLEASLLAMCGGEDTFKRFAFDERPDTITVCGKHAMAAEQATIINDLWPERSYLQ